MRIMVIGSGGAGKSTFSKALGDILQHPVYHLDAFFWKEGWVPTPDGEWDDFISELARKDRWIIDGNYRRTYGLRMKQANAIIFLDMHPMIATIRVVKRWVRYKGKARPDMNPGCPEKIDREFIRWVWTFRKRNRDHIMCTLREHSSGTRIVVIRNPGQARKWLDRFRKEGVEAFEQEQG
ncbi:MAG: AAA family ATPase [Clostridia bacterium]